MPAHPHLQEWDNPKAATAKDEVRSLMESPGWEYLMEAIQLRLRWEQKIAMNNNSPRDVQIYAKLLGEWKGLTRVEEIAAEIVKHGNDAEAELAA